MFAEALSTASPFIWSAVSGAIDGGLIGTAIGVTAGVAMVKISQIKDKNAGYNGKQVLLFCSSVLTGTVAGVAGGSAYQVGRDVLFLDTINNVGFTVTAGTIGLGILASRFSHYL